MKKNILVFSTQYMLTGGIESHLMEFCHNLSNDEIVIDLLILNSEMSNEDESKFRSICRNVYLAHKNKSFSKLFWLIKIGIKVLPNKYDAIYTNGNGEAIYWVKKIFRHSNWVHHHHSSGDNEDIKTWSEKYKKVMKNAPVVIACSTYNAQKICVFTGRRIDSIPCFSRKITYKEKTLSNKLNFGYFGRLIPEKGIDIICRLSTDNDLNKIIDFHIWGEGIAYNNEFFKKYPLIKYHGSFHSAEQLTEVISSLDAFILISKNPEGLPICLLEVMSAGLPWLSTDKGGIKDIACDPLSTRIIASNSSYSQIKQALLDLALDIKKGIISKDIQRDLYQKKFSSLKLTFDWKEILFK